MELMRVATFPSINQMVDGALQTQATMANLQTQESSGLVSSDYGGLGAQAGQVLNLQVSISQAQALSLPLCLCQRLRSPDGIDQHPPLVGNGRSCISLTGLAIRFAKFAERPRPRTAHVMLLRAVRNQP